MEVTTKMNKNLETTLIQIHGPASSGKTTVANELANRIGGIVCDEIIRKVGDIDLHKLAIDGNYAFKKELQLLKLHYKELETKLKDSIENGGTKYVIADRSLQCYGNYLKLYLVTSGTNVEDYLDYTLKMDFLVSHYHNKLKELCGNRMYIFGFDSVGFKDDGFRYSPDYELEKEIFMLDRMINRDKIQTVGSLDNNKRLEQIISYIMK